jgi:hypothetical protein
LGWGKKFTTPARIARYQLCPKNSELKFESNTKGVLIIRFPVVGDSLNPEADLIIDLGW